MAGFKGLDLVYYNLSESKADHISLGEMTESKMVIQTRQE